MSAGLEYLSGESEFRFNYYRGMSDEHMVNGALERITDGYTVSYGKPLKMRAGLASNGRSLSLDSGP